MARYAGDIAAGATIDFKFTTYRPSTGAPYTLAGTPAVKCYKGNSTTTETATGVTLTADFDSVTGLNHVRVVTTDTFYEAGNDYHLVITTGTVDSVSVVGAVVGHFSIENRPAPGEIRGTAATGTLTTTTFTTDQTLANDVLNNRKLTFLSGSLKGESVYVVDYANTSGQIWVAPPLTAAPSNGDRFKVE